MECICTSMQLRTKMLYILAYFCVVIQYGYSLQEQSIQELPTMNKTSVEPIKADEFPYCLPNFGKAYPMNDGVTDQCSMDINKGDVDDFLYELRKRDFNINLLKMHLIFSQEVNWTKCAISHVDWIWTYKGKMGGYPYLYLMKEFAIYSLSILNHYTLSMNFRITVNGSCPIVFGDRNTTERIALAFLQTFNKTLLPEGKAEMIYGYTCYISRTYLEHPMYIFSKYIINPKQSMGYRCCSNSFDRRTRMENITCKSKPIMIDNDLWWNFPYILGWLIFLYIPMLILKIMCVLQTSHDEQMHNDWLHINPISFSMKCKRICHKAFTASRLCSSILKIFCLMLTPVIIAVEVLAYYFYEYDFVVSSTKSEVPFNWVNMAAGYTLSKQIFLPCFGGPYVALVIYLISSSVLLCIPEDLSIFIENGLEDRKNLFASLLTVDLNTKGRFGAVLDIHRQMGYSKFSSILKANIYMLINPSFWILGMKLQALRLIGFVNMTCRGRPFSKSILFLVFTPIYVFLCLCEWLLAILLYGCPFVGFFVVLTRAYYNSVKRTIVKTGRISFVVSLFAIMFMSTWIAFDIYIFSLLFIDSFVFLSRICTYTFTGLIAYPDITYGYIVFTITVVIYVTESIQHVNVVYARLFEKLKTICLCFQNKNLFPAIPLVRTERSHTVISTLLFYYVVRNKRPVRVEILFSLIKVMIIVIILYMSISILLTFKEISKMSALTQAITALFICLVPKLWKSFVRKKKKSAESKEINELKTIVEQYCKMYIYKRTNTHNQKTYTGDIQESVSSSDEDSDVQDNNERCTDDTEELLLHIEIE